MTKMTPQQAQHFFRAANRQMRDVIKLATKRTVLYVHSKQPKYPPPLKNQRYRRTGRLGKSIATEVRQRGDTTTGVIGTNVVYAPQVIGLGQQKPIFEKRWWTLEGMVSDNKAGAIAEFEKTIDEYFEKL